jgi:hypothetical protein
VDKKRIGSTDLHRFTQMNQICEHLCKSVDKKEDMIHRFTQIYTDESKSVNICVHLWIKRGYDPQIHTDESNL